MNILVVSSSLNPASKSKILAQEAYKLLSTKQKCDWLDLQELELPQCDGNSAYGHPNVAIAQKKIRDAGCILFAIPIYNYDASSSGKNLIELTGSAWENKTVGFLCAAGGQSSYMSVMSLANSLMLDFRCLIIPRFVYAQGDAFDGNSISDPEIFKRIEDLVANAIRLNGINVEANSQLAG